MARRALVKEAEFFKAVLKPAPTQQALLLEKIASPKSGPQ